jgi:hypothetical protein
VCSRTAGSPSGASARIRPAASGRRVQGRGCRCRVVHCLTRLRSSNRRAAVQIGRQHS